jgi:hypothetical protein
VVAHGWNIDYVMAGWCWWEYVVALRGDGGKLLVVVGCPLSTLLGPEGSGASLRLVFGFVFSPGGGWMGFDNGSP